MSGRHSHWVVLGLMVAGIVACPTEQPPSPATTLTDSTPAPAGQGPALPSQEVIDSITGGERIEVPVVGASFILGEIPQTGGHSATIGGKFEVRGRRLWLWLDSLSYQSDPARPTPFIIDSLDADTLLSGETAYHEECKFNGMDATGDLVAIIDSRGTPDGVPRAAWRFDGNTLTIRKVLAASVYCFTPDPLE